MDRALAALERKDQYRRIAMGACALRLQMLALPRPAIIDFAAEREREDKRRFRLRIRRRKARAAQEHAVEVVSRLKAECDGLWDTIHGAGAWIANPYVAAISFTVERRNIDAPADCRNPREAPDAPH